MSKLKLLVLTVCILVYAYQLLSSGLSHVADDPGLGWHLQTGLYILNQGSLPSIEPFLATTAPTPVVSYQWLGDVLFASLYQTASWSALYSFLFSYEMLLVWCGLFSMTLFLSRSFILSILLTLCVSNLIGMHLILRPVLFQMLCFAFLVFYLITLDKRLREDLPLQFRDYALVTFLMVCWANVHPSFVLGIVIVGMFAGAQLLEALVVSKTVSVQKLKPLGALFLCTVLASLCTPYGFSLLTFIGYYLTSDRLRVQSEWQAAVLGSLESNLFIACVLASVLSLFLARRSLREIGVFPVLLAAVFFAFGFQAVRYIPLAAISSLFLTSVACSVAFERMFPSLKDSDDAIEKQYALCFMSTGLLVTLCSALTIWQGTVPFLATEPGPSREKYPYEAVDWLLKASVTAEAPLTILNHPNWGGFITFKGYPALKPVLDDRLYLVSEELQRDFLDFYYAEDGSLQNTLRSREYEFILLSKDTPALSGLKESFPEMLVYQDDISVILKNPITQSKQD